MNHISLHFPASFMLRLREEVHITCKFGTITYFWRSAENLPGVFSLLFSFMNP